MTSAAVCIIEFPQLSDGAKLHSKRIKIPT